MTDGTPPRARTTRVLVVMGAQRTGSTLLATALGMVPGASVAGELALVWLSRAQRRPCACLHSCADCPVWKPVFAAAVGQESSDAAFQHLHDVLESEIRLRNLPRLARPAGRRADDADHSELLAATQRLYTSLHEVTGADVLVDSSKSPAYVNLLRHLPDLDVRVVHVVRDPRGVVDSWSRAKRWESGDWHEEMRARSLPSSLSRWLAMNVAAEAVRRAIGASHVPRVRIEDFLADPELTLRALVEFAGLPADAPLPLNGGELLIEPNHALAGNVDRFDTGPVALRPADEWRTRLPREQQRAVRLLAWPAMARYGYSGS